LNKNIKRLKIFMMPKGVFGDVAHDRFIRFGHYVMDIGIGLDVFEGAYTSRRSSFSFKTGNAIDEYRQVEVDFNGHSDTKNCEIR